MAERLEMQNLVVLTQNGTTRLSRNLGKCQFLGIFLATLSSLFFSLCSVIVKEMDDVNPMELASFRFLGVLLPAIPIVIYNQVPVFPEGKRIILMLRCFVGTMGLMLSFYAFRHMPLADASVIIFSTPVFVVIFARLFLNEPCGMFNVVTVLLTLLGVVFITKPPLIFDEHPPVPEQMTVNETQSDMFVRETFVLGKGIAHHRPAQAQYDIWGAVAAFSSTLFGANAYVLLRALKGLHFSVIMTNFGSFALVYTVLVSYFVFGQLCLPACGYDRLLVLSLAIFSFLGQILLTLALQLEQAGPVALARSADIVFAFIWQTIFFKESPNTYSIIGASLVIISVVLTAFRKWATTLPRDSKIRQTLYFIVQQE